MNFKYREQIEQIKYFFKTLKIKIFAFKFASFPNAT